jgi:hypothetical protein
VVVAGPTLDFWQRRFETGQTAWDRGEVNPQLRAWLGAGALQPVRICVPGCGSGWEVAELARSEFALPPSFDASRSWISASISAGERLGRTSR